MRWVLWGTGVYGRRVLAARARLEAVLPGAGERFFPLVGVCDRAASRQGSFFGGCRIEAPEWVRTLPEETAILVALAQPDEVLAVLRGWGIAAARVFTMQSFCHWLFVQCAPELAAWGRQMVGTGGAARRLCAWLTRASALVRGACSARAAASGLSLASAAGVLDLALSDQELRQFYRSVTYEAASRPLRTIALHYPRFHNGGVERVISAQLPVLRALGYRVVLLLDAYEAAMSYDCPADVPIVVLGRKDDGVLAWYRRLAIACRQYDVDGVYCHRYLLDAPLLPWLVRSQGLHLFAELHSVFLWWVQSRYELLRLLLRQAQRCAVLSRVDARFWQIEGVRAVYLPNPLPMPDRAPAPVDTRRDVYWIGRLEKTPKRVFDVVPIVQQLRRTLPETRMHLFGATDHPAVVEELRRRIEAAGLEDAIVFEGYRTDLEAVYRRARVCLMTSRWEGFPMVLVEALAAGVPVVMYDLPYLEVVRQCQGIARVPMGDAAGAAAALASLLADDGRWQDASRAAASSLRAFARRDDQRQCLRAFLSEVAPALQEDEEAEETMRILVDTLLDWQLYPPEEA